MDTATHPVAAAEELARARFIDAIYDMHENRNPTTISRCLAASQELEDARRASRRPSRARRRKAA